MLKVYKVIKKIFISLVLLTSIGNATTYAPPVIKGCSFCPGLIIKKSLRSGNTFGAVYWTDGKMSAPMLPTMLKFVKCPHCKTLLWIDEQKTVVRGRKGVLYAQRKYGAKLYLEPELEDYFKALEQTNISLEKEIYLRFHAWWKGNDQRRYEDKEKVPMSEKEKDNLIELYELLSIDKYHIAMAEIKRELGEFDKAKEILNNNSSSKSKQVEILIIKLIKQRDSNVALIVTK